MPRYYVEYTCNFMGHYGGEWIDAAAEPEGWELEELAMQHFSPMGEVTEVEDDEEEDN